PLGSWIAALKFVRSSGELIHGGVRKYGPSGKSFKISTPGRWVVVATSDSVLDELKNADPSVLSMQAAANERNSIGYTLSSSIHTNPYHVDIVRKGLSQHLAKVVPDIVEKICWALSRENLDIGDEWARIDIYHAMLSCISATTNRVLVGPLLSRDPEYLKCQVELSEAVSRAGLVIDLAPRMLKAILAYFLVARSSALRIFLAKLGPAFEERQRMIKELAGEEWKDKPNDGIQWVLEASPPGTSVYELCARILYVDFSAIHTTTVSIIQALYDLGARPEFQDPIRDEIESVLVECGGFTKEALIKMKKLDSALKETQRLEPVTTATMMRKALKPMTLSDGTYLPKGQWVVAPACAINRSTQHYANPDEYDAFRFSRMREGEEPGHEAKHQLTCPEKGYLSFGRGKHACPGRAFAAAQLKVLLAYMICNYEFRTSPGEGRPQSENFSFSCLPDLKARLLFRKRADAEELFLNLKKVA
ncbi:cytochrome P450, partial [Tricharina praecox]|uniref:cytochrome P450 n=1 Tax=Tricharina praecox TaxID=43433 RepID=UPI00221E4D02